MIFIQKVYFLEGFLISSVRCQQNEIMAKIIDIPKFTDSRGDLCVIENLLPFDIKRIYYIFNVDGQRGGHRHKQTKQALICLSGSCAIFTDNGKERDTYILDKPEKCLIIDPQDWHSMSRFSKGAILLVMASKYYDANDYISEQYCND